MKHLHPMALGAVALTLGLFEPGSAQAANQNTAEDDSYVTLSGTVGGVSDKDEFTLNYGGGTIKVDTNDAWPNLFNRDANNATRYIREGDRVVVTGKVDDNWFTQRELDAYSLRHQRGSEVFNYEAERRSAAAPAIKDDMLDDKGSVTITGTVSKVEDNGRYLVRYPGKMTAIRVDASALKEAGPFNVGDRVTVTGPLTDTLFTRKEIKADGIIGTSVPAAGN